MVKSRPLLVYFRFFRKQILQKKLKVSAGFELGSSELKTSTILIWVSQICVSPIYEFFANLNGNTKWRSLLTSLIRNLSSEFSQRAEDKENNYWFYESILELFCFFAVNQSDVDSNCRYETQIKRLVETFFNSFQFWTLSFDLLQKYQNCYSNREKILHTKKCDGWCPFGTRNHYCYR